MCLPSRSSNCCNHLLAEKFELVNSLIVGFKVDLDEDEQFFQEITTI